MDIADIWKFELRRGNSDDPRNGACLLDAVSWLEYGQLGDRPACVCPVHAAFARGINDAMSNKGRQRLRVFIPRLVGTVDKASEKARGEFLAWQAIRVFAPIALRATGLRTEAESLAAFNGTLTEAAVEAAWAAVEAQAAAVEARRRGRRGRRRRRRGRRRRGGGGRAAEARRRGRRGDGGGRRAAAAAQAAAEAGCAANRNAVEDAMVAALDGVLRIGRQAELVPMARLFDANMRFAHAREAV